jgi:hypothetical protein
MPQDRTFMHGDVIGLVAFDLVLRIILARMMDVTLVAHVARMYSHDPTADSASLRVPTYVITDFESLRHKLMLLSNHSGSIAIATGSQQVFFVLGNLSRQVADSAPHHSPTTAACR